MGLSPAKAITITLSLIIMSFLLPRGLLYVIGAQYQNVTVGGTTVTWSSLDPVIDTMFTVVLPLIITITIMLYYIPKFKK